MTSIWEPEPPFLVMAAGFMVDLHTRKRCPHCRQDGTCPRVQRAKRLLRAWRLTVEERRRRRYFRCP
ncbi:hypothetical protein [Micromonospora sp. AMSO31t]|uniref:hypothetical protein n=1 Tax=Micromonospora sp. AMSO31t TaxID=2650566 RepID=UPI00124B5E32|nr:hypothetical protein [Micromonospora sp. AMSO31t]KAB1914025.1 hypothetical protein F8274_08600 [Micromonospora sp. AMSO31t]